mmetsp:Transcript_33311/g.99192  ORF Transcript_33311/g.99192 Transcript_33311/m.99192 type:complete len:96 (-) Transcript_33311:2078-2365(-)|eukprot:366391-Chlamydomonas_euryale.AAC.14
MKCLGQLPSYRAHVETSWDTSNSSPVGELRNTELLIVILSAQLENAADNSQPSGLVPAWDVAAHIAMSPTLSRSQRSSMTSFEVDICADHFAGCR